MSDNEITPAYPLATASEVKAALKSLSPAAKQQRRLINYLMSNQAASTVQVCQNCAITNISDVSRTTNRKIYEAGLYVFCQRPNIPLPNRFGDESNMFYWFVGKLPADMIKAHNERHGIKPTSSKRKKAA